MRSHALLCTLALLPALAGCLSAMEESAAPAAGPAPLPFEAEGVVWLPGSSGMARDETRLPFPVNASGMAITVTLHLGTRMGVETPFSVADVEAELRDPAGAVLGKASLRLDRDRDAEIRATAAQAGAYVLAILSHGGSDGEAHGDYVRYGIRAA